MSGGASAGSQDTSFIRQGGSTAVSKTAWGDDRMDYSDPWSMLVQQTPYRPADAVGEKVSGVDGYRSSLLSSKTPGDLPYKKEDFDNLMPLRNMAGYFGSIPDVHAAQIDPTTTDYAQKTKADFFDRGGRLFNAISSNPETLDGGIARQGYANSDAMLKLMLQQESLLEQFKQGDWNRHRDATDNLYRLYSREPYQDLTQTMLKVNDQSQGMEQLMSQAARDNDTLQSKIVDQFIELLTTRLAKTTEQNEDFSGKGAQSSSSQGMSLNCCWILLEAYRGEMPTFVRAWRDYFAPENSDRREGYRKLAERVVPAMRASTEVRRLIEGNLVEPLEQWGGWALGLQGYEQGRKYAGVVTAWFRKFEQIAKEGF